MLVSQCLALSLSKRRIDRVGLSQAIRAKALRPPLHGGLALGESDEGGPVAERGSVSLPFMAGVFRRVTGSPVENSLQRARKTARERGLGFKREEFCSKEEEVWLQPKRFGLRSKSQRLKANSLLFEHQEQVVKRVQLMLNQKLLELKPNLFCFKQNHFLLKPKEPGS